MLRTLGRETVCQRQDHFTRRTWQKRLGSDTPASSNSKAGLQFILLCHRLEQHCFMHGIGLCDHQGRDNTLCMYSECVSCNRKASKALTPTIEAIRYPQIPKPFACWVERSCTAGCGIGAGGFFFDGDTEAGCAEPAAERPRRVTVGPNSKMES